MPTWEMVTEEPHEFTDRLEVPGGWLYRTEIRSYVAMCFVPEPSPKGIAQERTSMIHVDRLERQTALLQSQAQSLAR